MYQYIKKQWNEISHVKVYKVNFVHKNMWTVPSNQFTTESENFLGEKFFFKSKMSHRFKSQSYTSQRMKLQLNVQHMKGKLKSWKCFSKKEDNLHCTDLFYHVLIKMKSKNFCYILTHLLKHKWEVNFIIHFCDHSMKLHLIYYFKTPLGWPPCCSSHSHMANSCHKFITSARCKYKVYGRNAVGHRYCDKVKFAFIWQWQYILKKGNRQSLYEANNLLSIISLKKKYYLVDGFVCEAFDLGNNALQIWNDP